jgi:antirestriction protein ArdC
MEVTAYHFIQKIRRSFFMNRSDIYDAINTRILQNLENGQLFWRQPWKGGLPANYITKHVYQGINFLLLCMDSVSNPFYLTFLQAQSKKLRIKAGSKGRQITFYKLQEIANPAGIDNVLPSGELETKRFPYLKFSYVFNLEDLECYEIPQPTLSAPLDLLNEIVAKYAVDIRRNLERCFYNEQENYISTPDVSHFTCEEEYFAAQFHELIHWSGHPERLNRVRHLAKGDEIYAFEELIAEIGASYLLGLCGIQNVLDNSSAYLETWLRKAKGDNSFILSAAIAAQKAVNFLIPQPEAVQ